MFLDSFKTYDAAIYPDTCERFLLPFQSGFFFIFFLLQINFSFLSTETQNSRTPVHFLAIRAFGANFIVQNYNMPNAVARKASISFQMDFVLYYPQMPCLESINL